MPTFAAKPAPAGDKLRGGYYTPEPVARFLARWVAEAGPRLLEPACGDGAILVPLVAAACDGRRGVGADAGAGENTVVGVELVGAEAATAARRSGVDVVHADFFTWFTAGRHGGFDGVAGNPPYIRFGSWDEAQRAPAFDLMRSAGLRPSRLTNAWVPFVVASLLAVRPGGRVGLVLPAELLQVGYAAPVRSYLVDACAAITVVSFAGLLFPGVQQEVVLLLAERGAGPARIRTVEVAAADALAGLAGLRLGETSAARAGLHDAEKWTQYHLEFSAIDALRRMRADPRLPPLAVWGGVDVGVVTGRNAFFCMSAADVDLRGLGGVTVALVARSAQLAGLAYTADDLARQEHDPAGVRTRLLAPPAGFDPGAEAALAAYLAAGEADGVPDGYKCRIRRRWWEVPSVWTPDAFLLRQIAGHPRIVANAAGATSTDTVHRVRVRPGVDAGRLAVAAFNSATFACAEIVGRSYGGGILELEPSEAEELPVPDPALVPDWLAAKADELVRQRRTDDALDLVDRVLLVDAVGVDPGDLAVARSAWQRLRDRRSRRPRRRSS
jgi:adenine-specific DNA methylase